MAHAVVGRAAVAPTVARVRTVASTSTIGSLLLLYLVATSSAEVAVAGLPSVQTVVRPASAEKSLFGSANASSSASGSASSSASGSGFAWSLWGAWSECSRTCGGGVSVQERHCLPSDTSRTVRGRRRRRLPPSAAARPPAAATSIGHERRERASERPERRPGELLSPPRRDETRRTRGVGVRRQRQSRGAREVRAGCRGLDRRYHECNTAACPGEPKEARAEQCASYDQRPFKGRFYTWVPYVDAQSPCTLNCRPRGQQFYASLSLVADGTPCTRPGFRAICVQGTCKVVGREGVLSTSNSRDPRCGRRLVSGLFTRPRLPLGYSHVATVPPGACRLNVSELLPSENYIALKLTNGSFIMNGEFAVSSPGTYEAAGAQFVYRRAAGLETIYTHGPTMHSLDIMILYQHPNPSIKYEYLTDTLPAEAGRADPPPDTSPPALHHQHRHHNTELHTKSLSTPNQSEPPRDSAIQTTRRLGEPKDNNVDVTRRSNDRSKDNHIDTTRRFNEAPKDNTIEGTRRLKDQPKDNTIEGSRNFKDQPKDNAIDGARRFNWKILSFTQCSRTCGGGIQIGKFRCVEEGAVREVSPVHCGGTAPASRRRRCSATPCPPRWRSTAWSLCPPCGPATQTRNVGCVQDHSRGITKISDSKCELPVPAASQPCAVPSCESNAIPEAPHAPDTRRQVRPRTERLHGGGRPPLSRPVTAAATPATPAATADNDALGPEYFSAAGGWLYTEWSECVGWCMGGGVRSRGVRCADPAGCAAARAPPSAQPCTPRAACDAHTAHWFTGEWSPCSAACGGRQVRAVVCLGGAGRRARDGACAEPRPQAERTCGSDCQPTWYLSDWSQCSGACGAGVQSRTVWCARGDAAAPAAREAECPAPAPPARRACTSPRCGGAPDQPPALHTPSPAHQQTTPPTDAQRIPRNQNQNPRTSMTDDQNQNNGGCTDRLSSCVLAVQARLCHYHYYSVYCCRSCGTKQ